MEMKKFYQVSHDNGRNMKVILANTKYEAIGFYLFEEVYYIGSESLDRVDILPSEHKIEMSCIGFPTNKTLQELAEENNESLTPRTVVSLEYN